MVEDCTAALSLQPDYAKALMRRGLAFEAQNKPSDAVADVKKALETDPKLKEAAAALPRLEKKAADELEQKKEEMMTQLKGLGNSILGNFGLSLDNFKAEQDPNTGSYNISFQK